jgi:hypothetical protein
VLIRGVDVSEGGNMVGTWERGGRWGSEVAGEGMKDDPNIVHCI